MMLFRPAGLRPCAWLGVVLFVMALEPQSVLAQRPGTLDTNFNFNGLTSGGVNALAITSSGQIYAGGSFTRSDGRRALIRLTGSGNFDSIFDVTVSGSIDAMVLDSATRLLTVGTLTGGFARFNPDGTADPASLPSASSPAAVVALPDGRILLGGFFSSPIRRLVRLSSSLVEDFATNAPDSTVEGLLLQPDGKIIVFGWFSTFGGAPVGRVLRLNADLSLDTTFDSPVDSGVVQVGALQADGKILIGGPFFSTGVGPLVRLARLNANGTVDTNFSATVSSTVTALAVDAEQRIYVSGLFNSANGSVRERLARFHPNGDLDTGFDPGTGPSSPANAIAVAPGGNVVLGGGFTDYNGVPRSRIARVFGGPSIPEAPQIIAQPAGTNVLAGFSPRLAVRATGGPRLYYQWQFNGMPLVGETHEGLTLSNIMPEDSGQYSVIVSNALGVVQSDAVSVSVLTFPPGFTSQPMNLARLAGQNAYLVTTVTGAPPPALSWFYNGQRITNQTATLSLTNVNASHAGDYFLIASNFLGSATSAVATLSITLATNVGGVDNAFRPDQLPRGTATNVTAAAIQPDGKVLIARNTALFRLLPNGALDPGFAFVQADDRIEALAVQVDGKILVGGAFRTLQGGRLGIARLQTNGTPDNSFAPSYGPRRVVSIAILPDDRILCASARPSFVSGGYPILSLLLPDGSTDTTFNTIWGSTQLGPTSVQTNVYGMELQAEGKILFDSTIGFQQLLPHGAIDIGFRGSDVTNLVDAPRVMALQNDGRIVVGGSRRGTNAACLFRLNADGTLDSSFNPGPTGARITAVLVAPDGKVAIAGAFTNIQGQLRNGVARLEKGGALDMGFDVGLGPVVDTNAVVRKILGTDSGQLVIAGAFTQFNDYDRPGVVRLLSDPVGPPQVRTAPVSETVYAGQSAQFSADVAAVPSGSMQWLFNGAPLEGETNLALRIDDAQPIDAGAYALTVSNSFGSVTSTPAMLTVGPAPIQAGAVDTAFHPGGGPNGSVLAAVRLADGKVIIGGTFTKVGGVTRNRIARLHADGTLDLSFGGGGITSIGTAPTPTVRALIWRPDGKIIVGGTLGYVDGEARSSIARLNSDGTVDPDFTDQLSGTEVYTIFRQADGRLVVGGRGVFTLGRLHGNGAIDGTFVRQVGTTFGTRRVEAITELPDGRFLVASTDPVDAAPFGLTRLQTNGVTDTTFQTVRSPVRSFVVLDDCILIGGAFTNVHGMPRRYFAALGHDGNLLSNAWSSVTFSDPVRGFARDVCGRVLVSGSFAMVNGQRQVGLARFFQDGTLDASFAPEFDGEINALIAQPDFRILAAGEFTAISGSSRRGVARILEDIPTLPLLVNQPANQAIRAGTALTLLAAADDCAGRHVFQWQLNGVNIPGATNALLEYPNAGTDLRGDFRLIVSNVAGAVTSAVATVTVSPPTTMPGNNDIDFFPQYTPTGGVRAIGLRTDGKLMVAGHFPDGDLLKRFHPDGSVDVTFSMWSLHSLMPPRPRLVAPEPDGTTLVCFDYEIGGPLVFRFDSSGYTPPTSFLSPHAAVRTLTVRLDGTIYLAGNFSHVGAYRSPGLARASKSGVVDTAFAANLPDGLLVSAMVVAPDGTIVAARRLAEGDRASRFLGTGLLDDNFVSANTSNSITALALQSDGRILVAGDFTNFNGVARPHLIRLNTNGSLDVNFSSVMQPGDRITAMAVQPDDKILLCGTNSMGAPLAGVGILRLQRDGSLDSTFDPGDGATGPITTLALSPSGSVYLAGQFDSYDGFARPSLARAHGNPRSQGAALVNNVFTVTLYTDLDRIYHLETRTALEDNQWSTIHSVTGSGSTQTLRDVNAGGAARFYRIRVE